MSEHGFYVHGPYDHELEHAQQGSHGGQQGNYCCMINQIAMFTAIKKTEDFNQWNYLQSKSAKQSLGTVQHRTASLYRVGSHLAFDKEEVAGIRHVWRWRHWHRCRCAGRDAYLTACRVLL